MLFPRKTKAGRERGGEREGGDGAFEIFMFVLCCCSSGGYVLCAWQKEKKLRER